MPHTRWVRSTQQDATMQRSIVQPPVEGNKDIIIYYPVQQKKADFRDRYRLTRPKFDILLPMIDAGLQHPTGRNQSLSPPCNWQ